MKDEKMTIEDLNVLAKNFDAEKAAAEVVKWVCGNIETFIDNHRQEFSIAFSSRDAEGLEELSIIENAFESLGISDSGIPEGDIAKAAGVNMSTEEIKKAEDLIVKFNSGEPVSSADLEEVKRLIDIAHKGVDDKMDPLDDSRNEEIDEEAKKLIILYGMIDKVKALLENDKNLLDTLFEKLIFYYELCGFRDGQKVERNLTGYVKIDEFEYFAYEIPVQVTPTIPQVDDEGKIVLNDDGSPIMVRGEATNERIPPSFNLDISIEYWEKKPMSSLF